MGEGFFASGRHAALLLQVLDFVDVYRAPDGGCLPRGEADGVGRIVNTLAHAVYPAVAQRFVDGFWPGHAGVARADFVEADQQFVSVAAWAASQSLKCCGVLKNLGAGIA